MWTCWVRKSAARSSAWSASSSRPAKDWNTWATSAVRSRTTSTPAALARVAIRVESSRSTSLPPAWRSIGGKPVTAAGRAGVSIGWGGSGGAAEVHGHDPSHALPGEDRVDTRLGVHALARPGGVEYRGERHERGG